MSDTMMFLIVGGVLGVLAVLSVALWILMLHKSHTEWRLADDNHRFTSPDWNGTSVERPSQSAR